MPIKFVWSIQTSTVPRETLESKIREDLHDDQIFQPCHSGTPEVHFLATDPLEHTISGSIICPCGKVLRRVSGASDGSKLTYPEG